MARLKNGLSGGMSGRIGNAETFILYGNTYVRAAKRKRRGEATEKQLAARMRMQLVNGLINSMTPFVRVGFSVFAHNKPFSANSAAKSYQLRHALTGDYPNLEIDYSKVKLSSGTLSPALNPGLELLDQDLRFSWDAGPADSAFESRAQTMLLAYCPELRKSHYKIGGACRYEREDVLVLPGALKGRALECYIAFAADDRSNVADSIYLGSMNV